MGDQLKYDENNRECYIIVPRNIWSDYMKYLKNNVRLFNTLKQYQETDLNRGKHDLNYYQTYPPYNEIIRDLRNIFINSPIKYWSKSTTSYQLSSITEVVFNPNTTSDNSVDLIYKGYSIGFPSIRDPKTIINYVQLYYLCSEQIYEEI